ncbi:hypothetical protein LguiA_007222 [Lonicera macranthoides]
MTMLFRPKTKNYNKLDIVNYRSHINKEILCGRNSSEIGMTQNSVFLLTPILVFKTKVVEQQRNRNTSRSIEILKQRIMKPRKENELLERRRLFQRRSGKAQKNADKNVSLEKIEDLTPTGQEKKKKKNMMWTLDMDKRLIEALIVQCHEGNKVEKCFKEVALKQ